MIDELGLITHELSAFHYNEERMEYELAIAHSLIPKDLQEIEVKFSRYRDRCPNMAAKM